VLAGEKRVWVGISWLSGGARQLLSLRVLLDLISSKALDSHMDFKLHSTITLRPRSFNVLVGAKGDAHPGP